MQQCSDTLVFHPALPSAPLSPPLSPPPSPLGPAPGRPGMGIGEPQRSGRPGERQPSPRRTVSLTPAHRSVTETHIFVCMYSMYVCSCTPSLHTWLEVGMRRLLLSVVFGDEDQAKQLCNTFFSSLYIYSIIICIEVICLCVCPPLSFSEAIPHVQPIVSPLSDKGCSAVGSLLD